MSRNTNAIPILEKNREKVDWYYLSSNKNANAISLLEKNVDKIHRFRCGNPSVIHLLEQNQDKINWRDLSENPNICCCDYDYYKKRMDIHREGLMKKVFHPRRLAYYLELGYDMFD